MTIFCGNLPYRVSESEIRSTFEAFGEVLSLRLIRDLETGESRGFAFVEMRDREALHAIGQLDHATWEGRTISVNLAKPRPPRLEQPA
jgi:RNA recognition motif-containing protein